MNLSIADLRQNYTRDGLTEANADRNPFKQFNLWFEQAIAAQLLEPNAMTLATVTPEGNPSARIVLLKHYDERGFVFFTNYKSTKGQHLEVHPRGALVFWWDVLERQVRLEGEVEKVPPEDSDKYFVSRPLNSQLGSWASLQSQVVESREVLEQRIAEFQEKYAEQTIPRPSYWGGFRLFPDLIEFWQGRPSRLHDRLRYRRLQDDSWLRERLCP
jgi:pyridoxamine 5'-phosphate oxidase